ncbi:murein L,D-transpeptidase catalytic domain family protein [Novosphingobium sp. KCTC 2891]|uniref:murein L,D-transpeptidase catalytic domain family protein n=1 Tax=Novosphingobium sp. KCTC 2891 TaxID=2989730 RepID=UPI00222295E2|nr:murein L,D-transpeptidase catalytic domain family protein [Novosphingobium sp. KCTC 2891]
MDGKMTKAMNRRAVLTGAAITAAAAALPARVFAQPYSISEQHRRVLDVARARVEQYRPSLWRTDIVGVADFALPSSLPRLHFADLEKGEVRSFLVAHGKGSDPEHDGFLKLFSNEPGSLATSRGGFITYEWYKGKYGTSIRLGGMDPDNSHVLDRAIVLHPAWYANPDMLEKWGKLGRSDGCFAMAEADFNEALWHLSGGRLLFADRLGIY